MTSSISPTPTNGGLISPVLTVEFMVNPDRLDDIAAKAVEIDDANNGEHLATYTIEQALSVVFHEEPEWLFTDKKPSPRRTHSGLPLLGWVINDDLGWSNDRAESHEEGK